MKKRILSVLCIVALAVAIAIPGIGTETANASENTNTQESDVIIDGPYHPLDVNGQRTSGFEITNNTEDTIYFGMTTLFMDESGVSVGTDSAFIPCIGPGESAYLYAVNNSGKVSSTFSSWHTYGTVERTSAKNALDLDIEEEKDHLSIKAKNTSSEKLYDSRVTVVFMLGSDKVSVGTAVLAEGGNETMALDAGSIGTANVDYPDQEYDDYTYYVTAAYGKNHSNSKDVASSSSEKTDASDSNNANVSASGADLKDFSEDDLEDLSENDMYIMQTVTSLTFLDEIPANLPSSAWDISAEGDGSVMAWTEPSSDANANETYFSELLDVEISGSDMNDLYIAGDGGVSAGEISECLFAGFENLVSIDFNDCFYVDNVTDMGAMFYLDTSLETLDVSNWNTSNVEEMDDMFYACTSMETLDVSNWDTSNVTNMEEMFDSCYSLETLDVSSWDTSNVVYMDNMFSMCSALKSLDVSGWDTSNVKEMRNIFLYCSSLETLHLNNWDTSNVVYMDDMFSMCSALKSLDVSGWDTSSVTDMGAMFEGCSSLESLDLSSWDTSSVTDMRTMFRDCSSLKELDLKGWNISNVESGSYMFDGCDSLQTLNVSGWDMSKAQNLLRSCPDQVKIIE